MHTCIRALACAWVVGLLAGCGGGGGGGGGGSVLPVLAPVEAAPPPAVTPPTDPGTPAPVSARLGGKVTAGGTPVAGATVTAGGQSATTGDDGLYAFTLDAPAATALVIVKSPGHLTMAKEVPLTRGHASELDIRLQAVDRRVAFHAADGVIAVVNGAVIDIPAQAIQDADGSAFTGRVVLTASYRNPTTAEGIDAFPQPYLGVDAGRQVPLQTVGVIEAALADEAGRPLQLRLPATLTYPGVEAINGTVASIPLWHYDEAAAIWVREGEAVRLADGSYQGQVTHFTQWNLDLMFDNPATLQACVQFPGGDTTPRHGIAMVLRGPGFEKYLGGPLAAGPLTLVNAPRGVAMTLTFIDGGNGHAETVVPIPPIGPDAPETVLSPCVALAGSLDWMPTPPPPPPPPVAADAPVNQFTGQISRYALYSSADDSMHGWIGVLTADAGGAITGSGGVGPTGQPMDVTGQMAVGGYFTLTGSAAPPYGPILFTGRLYMPAPGSSDYWMQGTWSYADPGRTPPGAVFSTAFDQTPS